MTLPQGPPPRRARNRPPRRWVALVAVALLVPAFVGASIINPARLVSYRQRHAHGVAGPDETLSAAGLSVRWRSTRIIRHPGADEAANPLPPDTALAVVSFDIAWRGTPRYNGPFCVVRLTDATGRVWTHSIATTNRERLADTGSRLPGNQTCLEAVGEGLDTGHWYRIEARMPVADDITKPLTLDIWDASMARSRQSLRFAY
ncbi:MAG: hypothetical protein ACRDMV_14070 [Streptosporangiales bacterium]